MKDVKTCVSGRTLTDSEETMEDGIVLGGGLIRLGVGWR